MVVRRDGDEDAALLDAMPDGHARAAAALRNPNAGEVLVSAAPGWEFVDLAGRDHLGGGSHGSLERADSEVPMLVVGLDAPPASITGIKETVCATSAVPPRRSEGRLMRAPRAGLPRYAKHAAQREVASPRVRGRCPYGTRSARPAQLAPAREVRPGRAERLRRSTSSSTPRCSGSARTRRRSSRSSSRLRTTTGGTGTGRSPTRRATSPSRGCASSSSHSPRSSSTSSGCSSSSTGSAGGRSSRRRSRSCS